MLNLRPLSSLLLMSGIVCAGFACSSGGTETGQMVKLTPTAGSGSSAAGSGSGGTGGPATTGGASTTAGTGSGQAGSQSSAGSGGAGGTGTGMGGAGTMGGAGNMGGAAGGTGGTATTGFCGNEAGKVILFDGSDATFQSWYPRNGGMTTANPWTNNGDGSMTVKNGGGDILTKMPFTNVCLHVEYKAPNFTYPAGTDPQQRGNSGVYLKGSYEMQVLDTFDLGKTENDYCGAVYKVSAPLVSACKTGGQWNAYDIEFEGNVCTNGTKTTNAKFVKVNLNDVNVQNNVVVNDTTQAGMPETCDPRGVLLQDHGTIVPVSFRNIWAIPRK